MSTEAASPEKPTIAIPIDIYGNNLAAACPCGRIRVVSAVIGPRRCSCGRRYKMVPKTEDEAPLLRVWERENEGNAPSYVVRVDPDIGQ